MCSFSKIANSAAQAARELGSVCKPHQESSVVTFPYRFRSNCGVSRVDPVTFAALHADEITGSLMLQSSCQTNVHRVE